MEQEIHNQLIERGENPEDFTITIFENGYSITPKWYYETKKIAKEEDVALALEVSQREIESIELGQQLGQQITELEIRVLERGDVVG